jgi:hypothetical protein
MGDAAPSHIDYIRQTSRRLNTTRHIHQDSTRYSKHTVDFHSFAVSHQEHLSAAPAHLRIGTVIA